MGASGRRLTEHGNHGQNENGGDNGGTSGERRAVEEADGEDDSIPPARTFKAFVLDDYLIPKRLPQAFKDFVIPEARQFNSVEHQSRSWTRKARACVRHRPGQRAREDPERDQVRGGSRQRGRMAKSMSKYFAMDRVENKASKEKAMGMLKAIEAHLLQKR
ncbi:uncharacterized protein LOC120290784 [Eucalyptus grandis]|uniref:uncharacterized protein LOC120290784 n=1 Tax=Eucalyptus grandis TaxID=71139 RepID=UPI00192EE1B5|nr:uncharacterized protein LOC120290784 [Eucalyptus grandis]